MTVIDQPVFTGNPGDIVRAVNNEDYPVKLSWDSRTHVLAPGQSTFIPWEVMMNYFGDPRASTKVLSKADEKGLRSFVADRPTEIRRIRTKWGFEMTDGDTVPHVEEYLADRGRKGDAMVTVRVPRIQFFGLEGEQIHTVVDDPAGDQITSSSSTVAEATTKDALIAKQGKQLDALMRIAQEKGWLAESEQEPVTEPRPVKATNGRTEELMAPPPSPDDSSDTLPEDEH